MHNIIPFIEGGATHFMHIGKDDLTSSYSKTYFSEIYQTVINSPTNLFNPSLDTNGGEGVQGLVVSYDESLKNRWFDSSFNVLGPDFDNRSDNYAISGGEGDAMWTNGDREGAIYSSHSNSRARGHVSPQVQWGFKGKDNSQQVYSCSPLDVGTYCRSDLGHPPSKPINLMFVR